MFHLDDRLKDLERRLARAESRERAMRWIGIVSLLCVLALLIAKPAVTQTKGNVVKAPFQVVDGRGKVVLEVDVDEQWPRLRLFNLAGQPVVTLYDSQGGGLDLYDREKRLSVGLHATSEGGRVSTYNNGGISIHNLLNKREVRPVVTLQVDNYNGKLEIHDKAGKTVFSKP